MTKVEELTEDMVFFVQGCNREFFEQYATKLNELVAAVREEERVRQEWLNTQA